MPLQVETVNIEADMPSLDEARRQVVMLIREAKKRKVRVLKVIHGYGSINFAYANARLAELDGYSSNYYDRILVLQRCLTATDAPLDNNTLNSGYKLIGTDQIKCFSNTYIQLSEVFDLESG